MAEYHFKLPGSTKVATGASAPSGNSRSKPLRSSSSRIKFLRARRLLVPAVADVVITARCIKGVGNNGGLPARSGSAEWPTVWSMGSIVIWPALNNTSDSRFPLGNGEITAPDGSFADGAPPSDDEQPVKEIDATNRRLFLYPIFVSFAYHLVTTETPTIW